MLRKTPNIFIVGAGPVATALAGGLRLAGVPVLGLWGRNSAKVRAAASATGVAGFSAAPPDILLEADVVVLAIKDDAVNEVARKLIASGFITQRHTFLHCSGVMSAEQAFTAVVAQVGGIGTLHPLRAMSDGKAAMRLMRGTVFGIEGNEQGKQHAMQLVSSLGGKALELSGSEMVAYHSAAAIAANFVVVLFDVAAELMTKAGIRPEDAPLALMPLMETALANVRERGTTMALTGPIRRGDVGTVGKHLEMLRETPAISELYRLLSLRAVELVKARGDVKEESLKAITALLDNRDPSAVRRIAP